MELYMDRLTGRYQDIFKSFRDRVGYVIAAAGLDAILIEERSYPDMFQRYHLNDDQSGIDFQRSFAEHTPYASLAYASTFPLSGASEHEISREIVRLLPRRKYIETSTHATLPQWWGSPLERGEAEDQLLDNYFCDIQPSATCSGVASVQVNLDSDQDILGMRIRDLDNYFAGLRRNILI